MAAVASFADYFWVRRARAGARGLSARPGKRRGRSTLRSWTCGWSKAASCRPRRFALPWCGANKLGRPAAWRAARQAGNGYSILEKQVSAGHEALDRGAKIMHELATLEQEYAKGLAKVAKALAVSMKDELPYARTSPWGWTGGARRLMRLRLAQTAGARTQFGQGHVGAAARAAGGAVQTALGHRHHDRDRHYQAAAVDARRPRQAPQDGTLADRRR